MSSLPGDVLASARTPTTVVDGDVVFSGVALLFVALGLAFVLYHYVMVHRLQGQRDAAAAGTPLPSSARQQGAVGAGAGTAAVSGVQGVVYQVALRASLPVTLYHAKDFAEEDMECAVCLGELYDGEAARFLPKCGHGFHAECVDLWLRSHPTCPLCRVDVDNNNQDASPSPLALPPVLPEPANYGATRLPANVLFFGSSQDDAATPPRTVGGPSSSGGTEVVVIEVPETTLPASAPREGDAAKSRGLARVRSIRRLWSRGRREVGSSSTSSSCHRATSSAHAEGGTGVVNGNFEL